MDEVADMEQTGRRSYAYRIAILWLSIVVVGSFWLAARGVTDSTSLAVVPEVPREGEPVVATFRLNNPTAQALTTRYQFFVNGGQLGEGEATIPAGTSQAYQYVYQNPLKLGEQINFVLKTQSDLGTAEKVIASPPYPPQVWSSFVSFAAMSSTMMSSMSSMAYYKSSFDSPQEFNVGLLTSVVLIALLVFLELTQPLYNGAAVNVLGRLRVRFSTVSWILYVIFVGVVYTRVVLILAS